MDAPSTDETDVKLIPPGSTLNSSHWIQVQRCYISTPPLNLIIQNKVYMEEEGNHRHSNSPISAFEPDIELPLCKVLFRKVVLWITSKTVYRGMKWFYSGHHGGHVIKNSCSPLLMKVRMQQPKDTWNLIWNHRKTTNVRDKVGWISSQLRLKTSINKIITYSLCFGTAKEKFTKTKIMASKTIISKGL